LNLGLWVGARNGESPGKLDASALAFSIKDTADVLCYIQMMRALLVVFDKKLTFVVKSNHYYQANV
jgi:hypothetical protein